MAEDIIYVRSGRQDNKVVLWDQNDAHPDGEVFVAADYFIGNSGTPSGEDRAKPVAVALTAAVGQKLSNGDLIRVSGLGSGPAVEQAEQIERNTGRAPVPAEEVDKILAAHDEERHQFLAASVNAADALDHREADLKRREDALAAREAAIAVNVAPATATQPTDAPAPPEEPKAPRRSNS